MYCKEQNDISVNVAIVSSEEKMIYNLKIATIIILHSVHLVYNSTLLKCRKSLHHLVMISVSAVSKS